jgi:hypothetical protein
MYIRLERRCVSIIIVITINDYYLKALVRVQSVVIINLGLAHPLSLFPAFLHLRDMRRLPLTSHPLLICMPSPRYGGLLLPYRARCYPANNNMYLNNNNN